MRKPLTDYDNLLGRVKKYINMEETQHARRGDAIRTIHPIEKKTSSSLMLVPLSTYALVGTPKERDAQMLKKN